MKLVATMPLRNEAWIVGLSARVVLMWADELVVMLHNCTDRTPEIVREIAAEHPGRVTVLEAHDVGWKEMGHRQRLLVAARMRGASHIAITDADEVLTGNLLPVARAQIAALRPGKYMQAGMPCLWRGLGQYRTDGRLWSGRDDLVLAFGDTASLGWFPQAGYEHHMRAPLGARPSGHVLRAGGVMHLQWASWRRLTAKHAWYQMHERLQYPARPVKQIAATYALAPDETGLQTAETPAAWWEPYQDLLRHVDLNAEPWHEAECKRLLDEHGAEKFAGLNLHGVDRCAATAI
jgi:hypothetical protein